MAWYEWVFSGIGGDIFSVLFKPIKSYLQNRKNNKLEEKQIKVLDFVLEQQQINDMPDIQYGNIYNFNSVNGLLQIEIINLGRPVTLTEIQPSFSWCRYIGPSLPIFIRANNTLLLQFQITSNKNSFQLPERYKIYLTVSDLQNQVYSIAIEITKRGINTTAPTRI